MDDNKESMNQTAEKNNSNWATLSAQSVIERASSEVKSIADLRKVALENFAKEGFPTGKWEEWKYTNLSQYMRPLYGVPVQSDSSVEVESVSSAYKVVLVNGLIDTAASNYSGLPAGVTISLLSEMNEQEIAAIKLGSLIPKERIPLAWLNTASFSDAVVIHVAKNVKVDQPIELICMTTEDAGEVASHPRLFVKAETGSKLTVFERYMSDSKASYFTNTVAEFDVQANAFVEHVKIQSEGQKALHVSNIFATQERDSTFKTQTFNFGSLASRNEIHPVVRAQGCFTVLNGLNVITDNQHIDNATVIDHAAPHCESSELYKGVYGGKSQGAFSGTIIVRQDSQKINAFQSNQSILMSDTAKTNSKPQLKIWADDVKCSHGATVGQLDDVALFYLQSRGIPKNLAKKLLVKAFSSEVVSEIENDTIKAHIEDHLTEALHEVIGL